MAKKFGVDWQSDTAANACRICSNKFTIVRRRHHCRSCGQAAPHCVSNAATPARALRVLAVAVCVALTVVLCWLAAADIDADRR